MDIQWGVNKNYFWIFINKLNCLFLIIISPPLKKKKIVSYEGFDTMYCHLLRYLNILGLINLHQT